MSSSVLPALKKSPKYIFFTDFDGTITIEDSNDYLTDNLGYGQVLRKQANKDILEGKQTFREALQQMLDSIQTPFDECKKALEENIKLDPYFLEFFEYCSRNNIPIVVLSGGMAPIIRALLHKFIGEEAKNIQIVSNDVTSRNGKQINEKGGWQIIFHDESDFGHDKSREIRPYANLPVDQRPTLFYAGDGVSDLSAARETDLLFAKKGNDLVTYCLREKVPFTLFEDWSTILSTVQSIVSGNKTVKDVLSSGVEISEKVITC